MKKLTFLLISSILLVLTSCDKQFDTASQNSSELKSAQLEAELKSGHMVQNFRAHLSGQNEVPANPSQATGEVIFQLSKDGMELSYKLIVANLDDIRMSHIHLAPEGSNGNIVVWLYPSAPPAVLIPGTTNGILAEGVITKANLMRDMAGKTILDLVEEFKKGNAYVNIHTLAYGGGEIRGQIK
ncbi:MAG TPA: CHRD domain-containing protein [Prolixibacteraceae bacterium]|nr:CHRD domain-containing protein [Prolixibacteraceae bacterium]